MDDQPTCGKGLAEHSALPAKLAELIAAMAEILELHQKTLDLTDENARREHGVYVSLAARLRAAASQLGTTAAEMAGHRDLPMGRHDETAMADPRLVESFAAFVRLEGELRDQLDAALQRDEAMLQGMGSV